MLHVTRCYLSLVKRACLASNVNELDERMERVCWCVFLSWGTRESVEEGSPYAPHTFGGAFCAERRKRVPVQYIFSSLMLVQLLLLCTEKKRPASQTDFAAKIYLRKHCIQVPSFALS